MNCSLMLPFCGTRFAFARELNLIEPSTDTLRFFDSPICTESPCSGWPLTVTAACSQMSWRTHALPLVPGVKPEAQCTAKLGVVIRCHELGMQSFTMRSRSSHALSITNRISYKPCRATSANGTATEYWLPLVGDLTIYLLRSVPVSETLLEPLSPLGMHGA